MSAYAAAAPLNLEVHVAIVTNSANNKENL